MPVSTGLLALGGVAEGLKQGLLTYQQQRQYQDEKKQKDALIQEKYLEQGKAYDPNTGQVTDAPLTTAQQQSKFRDEKIKLLSTLPEEQRTGTEMGRKLFNAGISIK